MKPITDHPFTPNLLTSNEYFWNCKTPEELAVWHNHPKDQFDALLAIVQNQRKLFSLIMTTIPTISGWCSAEKACALASLTLALKPTSVAEVGIWYGRSLLPMAMALKHIGSGIITGIDPYSPQESAKSQWGQNAAWWAGVDHGGARDAFLHFVKIFNLENHVRHIQKPSSEVNLKEFQFKLIHIDGNHSEVAVGDAERFGPLVPLGGIAVLDDLQWEGGGVLRAVDTLEEMGFVEVVRRATGGDNWNIMQRIK